MKYFGPLFLIFAFGLSLQAQTTTLEDIKVIDHSEKGQSLVDFIPSVTQLKGKELQKRRQTSIGDTLQGEAGITSTSYGPSAGRPVIRGLDGDRIRTLQNGLGTLDASTQSLDHAIPVDTLTIDQVEIVRGPMSLLYGSSAVGGVVNLITNRIHSIFEEGFFSQALVQGESVNNGIGSAVHFNYGKNQWMFHADASTRNLGDQEIPGYAKSSKVREAGDEKRDKLPNSFNKQDNLAVGVSKIHGLGYYGFSYNQFNTEYGTVADEEVTIDMTQNRFEFHGELRPEGWIFRKLRLKSAQSDYHHKEIEDGSTGTVFKNRGNESRLEGFNKAGDLEGISGLQTQIFNFSAKGEEAFLPDSENAKVALFSFQELSLNRKNAVAFGGRAENSKIVKKKTTNFGEADTRNFLGLNASLGHQYKINGESSLSTSFSYTERAPNFQELYADGAHVATNQYEKGDSGLKKEKAKALEVSFKSKGSKHHFMASTYTQFFQNYISLTPNGEIDPGSSMPIYEFRPVDAVFYGADLEGRRELSRLQKGALNGITKFDIVRAKDKNSGHNLPRISPPRLTMALELERDRSAIDLEVQYVADQTKRAPEETRTDSYTLTNLGYTYNFIGDHSSLSVFGRIRNIFDVEARNHVSSLKDLAPLPGRNLVVGAQLQI